MKFVKLIAVLSLMSGCTGTGPYGPENPNADRNVAMTGAAAGAAMVTVAGLVGLAVFLDVLEEAE